MASANTLGCKRPVTVVGAGFSGLASAYYLQRAGFQVQVYEQSDREGGLIATHYLPQGAVETAANGLLNSPKVEELFESLGLPLQATRTMARKRYIYRGGRPRRWPLGFWSTIRMIFVFFRLVLARQSLAPRSGESVRSWSRRVAGHDAAEYTIEAILQGIYAGDPARMSATLIFGRFFRLNRKVSLFTSQSTGRPSGSGSVFNRLGRWIHNWRQNRSRPDRPRPDGYRQDRVRGTVSAPNGMGQLMYEMRLYLEKQGVQFRFNSHFQLSENPPHQPVVLAGSAHQAGQALRPLSPIRASLLDAIELIPLISVTAFFRDTDDRSQGFGCLFPRGERRRALGVLKNNFIFDNRAQEGFSETWILGGLESDVFEMSDSEIIRLVTDERRNCFGCSGEVIAFKVTRWPKGIPHYTIELERILPNLKGIERNVLLMGNYLGQIGLAKILESASQLPLIINEGGSWS
jgi:oxygen-dependent protoporphyrinogen oxidase